MKRILVMFYLLATASVGYAQTHKVIYKTIPIWVDRSQGEDGLRDYCRKELGGTLQDDAINYGYSTLKAMTLQGLGPASYLLGRCNLWTDQ